MCVAQSDETLIHSAQISPRVFRILLLDGETFVLFGKLRHLILFPCDLPGRQTTFWASVWMEILRSFYCEFMAYVKRPTGLSGILWISSTEMYEANKFLEFILPMRSMRGLAYSHHRTFGLARSYR